MPDTSQFNTDRTYAGRWTITFSNPPINIFGPATIVELGALMTDLEADPSVKVVVFQSANPDSSPISTYPRQLDGQRW
jgi:enoyl-CoA hydratase/carnithine racemase